MESQLPFCIILQFRKVVILSKDTLVEAGNVEVLALLVVGGDFEKVLVAWFFVVVGNYGPP